MLRTVAVAPIAGCAIRTAIILIINTALKPIARGFEIFFSPWKCMRRNTLPEVFVFTFVSLPDFFKSSYR